MNKLKLNKLNFQLKIKSDFFPQSVGGWRHTAATKALAKPSLAGLAWSCAVTTQVALEEEGKKIVDVSSLLTRK